MSKRGSTLYLKDILDSISKIQEYTNGLIFDEFINNDEKIDAVVRNLEIIGEAANRLPKEIIEKHPEILWEKIISMRNKILHEYFGIDEDIIWKTINDDLPELRKQLEALPESSLAKYKEVTSV